jgi:MFS family permease
LSPPRHILPLIVLSQFAGTSLWFAGNAILPDLKEHLDLGNTAIAGITSVVQFGFIAGTLAFAFLSIADRFSAPLVFFISSLLAAAANISINWLATDELSLMLFRFITGFFLAGIYPVGMKLAAEWYEKGLGKALGWLVGALVLGTALPHLLKAFSFEVGWQTVTWFTSIFALTGGLLVLLFVKEGPYRNRTALFKPGNMLYIFRSKDFRSAAFGYFGHMWELYAFWAFVPVIVGMNKTSFVMDPQTSIYSFIIIAVGSIGCIAGGYVSRITGSAKVAFWSLIISGICCCLSLLLINTSTPVFLLFMIIWGITVISDSPQFSALVAQTAPAGLTGTAITTVTCIGFAITIGSIQLLSYTLENLQGSNVHLSFLVLAIGPLTGLMFLRRLVSRKKG